MTSADEEIRVEQYGLTQIWTLNRPQSHNALSRNIVRKIGHLAREIRNDTNVRSIILTGSGEKAFCAGADLKERRNMSLTEIRDFLAMYRTELYFLDTCPKPVICALNGVAFGGGLEIALCCDLRIAASHVFLGLTEVSLGIIPGAGGTQRLTRLVGEARAKEMLLLSQKLSAPEALKLGLINRVMPEGQTALDGALEWAQRFEKGAPIAMTAALEAVDASVDLPLDAGLAAELRCYEKTLVSQDRIEALNAFLEKREAKFMGQ